MRRALATCLLLCLLLTGTLAHAETGGEKELEHFLLLGFDFWGDEQIGVSYSDTNILATIDRTDGRLMVTSLLRDTYVEKPDGKWTRLNNVVRDEGFDAMLETISLNYGVTVERYLAIGVKGLRRVIDSIGGIEVTLSSAEAERLQHVSGIRGAGTYTLSSSGVMHYMRLRKIAGHDFSRTERQRKVLAQVLIKVQAMSLADVAQLGAQLFDEIETNMTLQDVLGAVSAVYQLRDAPLETLSLPVEGKYENTVQHGMSVYALDWPENRRILHDFLYEGSTPDALE